MAALVCFPKVGANVTEGAVGVWHKQEGDRVSEGDPLVEIITSKATFDVEAPAAGLLRRILAPEKSILPVGFVLGIVAGADEPLPDVDEENRRLLAEFKAQAAKGDATGTATPVKKVRATPGARRLAKELGVDLTALQPSGGSGVIREDDVRRQAEDRG